MSETKRILLAGFLVALLFLFMPFYLSFIGVDINNDSSKKDFISDIKSDDVFSLDKSVDSDLGEGSLNQPVFSNNLSFADFIGVNVVTDYLSVGFTNIGGGSINDFQIIDSGKNAYKYVGGYDSSGIYNDSINVSLLLNNKGCSPCLSNGVDVFVDAPFVAPDFFTKNRVFNVFGDDSLSVSMVYETGLYKVKKTTVFYGNKYIINHFYEVEHIANGDGFYVNWLGGLRDTEKNKFEESTYSAAYLAQNKEISDLAITPSENFEASKEFFNDKVDWVAVRNKYFINSLISSDAVGGFLGGDTFKTPSGVLVPEYSMGLKFNSRKFSVGQYFGPLDIDTIGSSNTYLDRVMNFGWLPIQPFSRFVLWLLKKLNFLGVNYGIILVLFAFLIRVVTGPLTKKSHESSQNMQKIQPKIKKIQNRYKNDSQRMNKKIMELYKESGVNPLGGCLPMLIQMPLLFALFIVFRSTIEFRGASFFWWISDLSQPDTIFNLPFSIPLYGDQVAFLPFLLGVSMFLSQKISAATMEKQQKMMMYMMSVFFFLLFNSFPSGLNLYYVVYNLLNYQQLKSMKKA